MAFPYSASPDQNDQFWMVWNPNGNAPTFRHHHPEAAKVEAERLARLHPGQKFHVLALIGTCEFQAVKWQVFGEGEIPF